MKINQIISESVTEATGDSKFDAMMDKISSLSSLTAEEAVDMINELMHNAGASYKEALHQASISFEIEPKKLNAMYKQRESRDAFDGMFGGGNPAGKLGIRKESAIDEGEGMSRAAKGNEKYGKDGMKALAKAGREGASEKKLDTIRDKYDRYDESIEEARDGDTNFGSTVGHGSWVVYDGSKVKRFKSRECAKAYAEKNGGKVASSEFYADKIQKQGVAEGSLNELAVDSSGGREDDEYDLLFKLVKMWWTGNEQQHFKAEKTLASMGISIEENEPDIILHRGKQFLKFPMDDFEQGVAEGESWSKHNNPRAGGMSKKSVSSYRRSHPGSKIQTAVTTKPSKLKKGSKAAKRRKSFCARMSGMKKRLTSAKTARDPNSKINKSLRRWHCESIEQMQELVMLAEQFIAKHKK